MVVDQGSDSKDGDQCFYVVLTLRRRVTRENSRVLVVSRASRGAYRTPRLRADRYLELGERGLDDRVDALDAARAVRHDARDERERLAEVQPHVLVDEHGLGAAGGAAAAPNLAQLRDLGKHPTPSTKHQAPSTKHQAASTEHRAVAVGAITLVLRFAVQRRDPRVCAHHVIMTSRSATVTLHCEEARRWTRGGVAREGGV